MILTKKWQFQQKLMGVTQFVPLDKDNIDYEEILKQVDDGTLTIADAD